MSNEKNNIDELFKGKLREFSVDAPEHVWKGIEASRTPLHRAINYFKGKKGAAIGSFILLATVSSIAYFASDDTTLLSQETATTYTIQKHNNSSIQAAKLNDAPTLQVGNSYANNSENIIINDAEDNSTVNTSTSATTNTTPSTEDNSSDVEQNVTPVVPQNGGTTPTLPPVADNNPTDGNTDNGDNTAPTSTQKTTEIEQPKNNDNTDNTTFTKDEQPTLNEGTKPLEGDILTAGALPSKGDETEKTDKSKGQQGTAIEPSTNFSKFTADIYAGGNYTMRSLKGNGNNPSYIEAKRNAENYTAGIVVGARVNYDIKDFLTLRVGAQYSRFNQRINLEREYKYTTVETVTGIILDPVTQQPIGTTTRQDTVEYTETARANNTNTISFLDIPVQLELNVYKTEKYSIFATTGAAVNLRFTQKGHLINERLTGVNELSSANNPYNTTAGISILAGVGVNYNITKRYSLLLETTYQHGISDVMKVNSGISQNYRIITGSIGLRYRF